MDARILKKQKTGSILRIVMICAIACTVIFLVLGAVTDIERLFNVGLLTFFVAVPVTAVYLERFMTLNTSIKYLDKHGYQDSANDINLKEFDLPVSKISLGKQVFYAKNPPSIIPYAMVAWVYIHQTRYMGIVTVDETIKMHCRDGQLFQIKAKRDELNTLLQRIHAYSPDLVVGYGDEQRRKYEAIKGSFNKK